MPSLHLDLPKKQHVGIVVNLRKIRAYCGFNRHGVVIMHEKVCRRELIVFFGGISDLKHAVVTRVGAITNVYDAAEKAVGKLSSGTA